MPQMEVDSPLNVITEMSSFEKRFRKDTAAWNRKMTSGCWHTATVNRLVRWGHETSAPGCSWMGDRISMSISADSPLDETLKQGPLAMLLRQQYEFPFGINIVHFSIFNFSRVKTNQGTLQ